MVNNDWFHCASFKWKWTFELWKSMEFMWKYLNNCWNHWHQTKCLELQKKKKNILNPRNSRVEISCEWTIDIDELTTVNGVQLQLIWFVYYAPNITWHMHTQMMCTMCATQCSNSQSINRSKWWSDCGAKHDGDSTHRRHNVFKWTSSKTCPSNQ